MAGSTLTYTIIGEDKSASRTFDKVGAAADKSAKKASTSWSAAGKALSGLAIVKFGADSVKAFSEAEASTAKLQQAFQKFPKLGDSSAASIDSISAALQKKTKFDGDATNAAAAQLAQFDLTGKQIEKMLPLLQDYASATGQDIESAATAMGKALNGQTRALKAVGINYTSTGDKAKDFANITDLLNQKVGGFAENEGKTAAGQLEILKNQFGDVQEAIGGALVPALTEVVKIALPMAEVLGNLVKWFSELPGPVKLAAVGVIALNAAMKSEKIMAFATSLKSATTSASGFKSALSSVGKGLAIGGAIALFTELASAMGEPSRKAKQTAADVQSVAEVLVAAGGKINAENQQQYLDALRASTAYQTLTEQHISDADAIDYLSGKTDAQTILQQRANMSFDAAQKVLVGLTAGAALNAGAAQKQAVAIGDTNRAAAEGFGSVAALGEAHREATAALRGNEEATKDLGAARTAAGAAEDAYVESLVARGTPVIIENQKAMLAAVVADEKHTLALQGMQEAASDAVAKSESLKDALDDLSPAAQDAADAESELSRAVENVNAAMDKDKSKTYEEAMRSLHGEISGLTDAFGQGTDEVDHLADSMIDSTGHIDTASKSGQDLYDTVTTLADAQHTAAQAAFDHAGGLDHAAKATTAAKGAADQAYSAFIDTATALGLSKDAAEKLAAQYGLVPSEVATTVKSNAEAEKAKVDAYNESVREADGKIVTTTIRTINENITTFAEKILGPGKAAGGTITGGVAGQDSVPAMMMPGEEVIRASAAGRGNNRSILKAMNAGVLHFAGGGSVPGFNFKGASAPSYGERQGNVVGAFGDLKDWLKGLADAAKDLRGKADDSRQSLREAANELAHASKEDKAAAKKKYDDANRQYKADDKAADAAEARSKAEQHVYDQTSRTRTLLSSAAKVYDQYNKKLDDQRAKLANLKNDRAQLAGSVAGNISGIGGGILGFSEQRNNPASILRGMQFNLKGQTAYTKNLAALKAKGLSPALLAQIAQGGEEGQRTAASLAGASRGQIAQINRTQAAIDRNAKVGGNLVGGAVYDKQIAAQQKQIDATAKTAAAALDAIGAFSDALTKGFKLDIDSQGIARLNAKGVADLKRRGVRI